MSMESLKKLKVKELLQRAELLGVEKPSKKKGDLLAQVVQAEEASKERQALAAQSKQETTPQAPLEKSEPKPEEKKSKERHVCGCLDIMSETAMDFCAGKRT